MLAQGLSRGRKAGVLLVTMLASCIAIVSVASAQNRQGYLGVTTQTLTDALREGLDFSYEGSGALVNNVSDGSPADRAGLRTGDIITAVDGRRVTGSDELRRIVRSFGEGDEVTVRVIRDGESRSFSVRLAGIDEDGVTDRAWRDRDGTPVPEWTPRAPRAPRPPVPPRAPAPAPESWFHFEDDGDDDSDASDRAKKRAREESLKESLEGMKEFHRLHDLPRLDGLERNGLMIRTLGRGRLGVTIEDLDSDMADALGLSSRRGALVRSVVENSPAQAAGIRVGDVITRVNDSAIENSSDLTETIRGLNEGPARITVVRRSGVQTLTANLRAREDATRWRSVPRRFGPGRTWERMDVDRDRLRERADRMRERAGREREDAALQQEVEELRREVERLRRELERRDDR